VTALPYSVNLWGSDPAEDNDDCWTGLDFATREEAERAYADPAAHFLASSWTCTVFVELDGPDVHEERRVRPDRRRPSDADWIREHATQAGMALGCDGYNDAMGY